MRIFSVLALTEVKRMQTPGNVSVVAWSPNRQLIATGYDYPYRLGLWEVQTGAVRGTLPNKFLGPGLELCFSPDGMRLAGSDQGSIISVWHTGTLETIDTFPGHPQARAKGPGAPGGGGSRARQGLTRST